MFDFVRIYGMHEYTCMDYYIILSIINVNLIYNPIMSQ